MKKRILFLMISMGILTGCGGEKLTCTKEEETTKDMWIKQQVTMTFEKKKITKAKVEREVTVKGKYAKSVDTLHKSLKEEFTNFQDKAVKVKATKKGNTIKIKASANYKKMKEETKKSFGAAPYDKNETEMKKYFENQGFTCK